MNYYSAVELNAAWKVVMGSKIAVLVVDDDDLLRLAACYQLSDQGLEVKEAASAQQALDILRCDLSFECLFTDVDMPGDKDGLELAALVKSEWPHMHIVVTSAHRGVVLDDLPPNGVFVAKPYRLDVVGDIIHRLTAGSMLAKPMRRYTCEADRDV